MLRLYSTFISHYFNQGNTKKKVLYRTVVRIDLQSNCQKSSFFLIMSPAAQIHHTGKFHWVASVYEARTRQAMMETTGFVRHIGCR